MSTSHFSCQHCSMDVRAGRWRWIWRENKCYRRKLGLSYRKHKTNATGHYPRRTSRVFTIKRRKLSWFGHVCRHYTLPRLVLQETVDGSLRRSPRKSWKDNITEVDVAIRRETTTGKQLAQGYYAVALVGVVTHNLRVTRQNSFHWATARDVPWNFQIWNFQKFHDIFKIFHRPFLEVSLKFWICIIKRNA